MIIIKMTHKVAKSLTVHIFYILIYINLGLITFLSVYYCIANIELDTKNSIVSIAVIVVALINYSDPASFFVTNTSAQNMLHTKIMKKLLS
jgi:hypothetical protein